MTTHNFKKCPHCQHTIEYTLGSGASTTIGPDVDSCSKCKGIYATGLTEWDAKSNAQRFGYYLRVIWWQIGGLIYVALPFGFVGIVIAKKVLPSVGTNADTNAAALVGFLLGVIFSCLAYTRRAMKQIAESKERTR